MERQAERQSIGCARELEEAGIRFIKVDKSNATRLFDVNFKGSKMKIPMFVIQERRNCLFRNLIAYEQFGQGDDEAVAQTIDKLLDNVTLCGDTFFYQEVFDNVKQHCTKPGNTWKAKLRHDYFSTPWSGVAFFGALLVALATIGRFGIAFFQKQLPYAWNNNGAKIFDV
ncbi:hypothetical protein PTKIN_Ptkin14bG0229700 [Pterospermum kingtungense]